MRRKLIAGNWKMNCSISSATHLLAEIKQGLAELPAQGDPELAVCVPAPYFQLVSSSLAGTAVKWGAQDLSAHVSGAYTGEVAASMLNDFGCHYVIIGHSERRSYHGEVDESVLAKSMRALDAGITPIVCVGETLAERESGNTNAVVGAQVDAIVAGLSVKLLSRVVFAYEPVWAIGTGKTASAEMAQEVHAFIRSRIAIKDASLSGSVQILYGGSMKPENAAELLAMEDIDGGLIGGASLKAVDFLGIAKAVKN